MSHFTCLVVGDDVEGQLQPFHEFECTGTNDQYVIDVDKTDEMREQIAESGLQSALEYFGVEDRVVEYEAEVDREDKHKYGYAVVRDGSLVKYVDRTNPRKKWDYWTVGGRWSGYFVLRSGARADRARKGDVDFDAMRAARVAGGLERYRAFHAAVAGRDVPRWGEVRERHGPDGVEAARAEYNGNPVIVDLRKAGFWGNGNEDYLAPEPEFIARVADEAVVTFAVVKDGEWFEKGRMGWWACVSDEKDGGEWAREFRGLIEGLANETMLTLVDCHI